MIKAGEDVKRALLGVSPTTMASLREKLADPEACKSVGARVGGLHRFAHKDGTLVVRCAFGRGLYETPVELDAAVALAMNLATLLGQSAGRGRRTITLRAGGR